MKIRNHLLLFISFLVATSLNAQSQNEEDIDCLKELSYYAQSAKIKDYEAALPHYETILEHCPADLNAAVYQYGNIMFPSLINEAENKEEKDKYIDAYIKNNELLTENFPAKESKITNVKIAQLKVDNNIGSTEEQYETFDKIWKDDSESFTDPKALYTYFSLLIDLQDDGKRDLEDAFQKYDEVMTKIETEEAKRAQEDQELRAKREEGESLTEKEEKTLHNAGIYLKNYMRIKESIDTKIGTRADCDNLIPLFSKKFDEKKDDAEWLKIAANRLSAKKCTDGDLFFNITEALHEIEPSAKSAKYLGQLAAHKGQNNKAMEYYKQSADLEEKTLDKAKIYYMIAGIYKQQGSLSQARSNYRKALQYNPALGNAHLQIASMYANSANDCGATDFEKRAVYWLAANEAETAGRVDPSISKNAQQTVEAYRGRAPQAKDIFKEGKSGETINIGCWINESIKVPSL